MKNVLVLISFCFLISTNSLFSQFVVNSSSPANGTANVPLSTTLSFTFSAPLDTSQRYGMVLLPTGWVQIPISISGDPRESISINSVSYTPDLRTILFSITHTSNTDFSFMITGAKSNAGVNLSTPYALNYSTSLTIGTRTVSGTVSYPGGNPINSIVVLFDLPLFGDEEGYMKASTIVTETSGAYIINYVRDGVYWPAVVKDINANGEIDFYDAIGFYDPNSDGNQDSIIVSGGNVTNINMTLSVLFASATAKTYLDTVQKIAQQYATDQELRAVFAHGDTVGLDGTSPFWGFQFYSNSKRFVTTVLASSFIFMSDTTDEGGYAIWLSNMKSIPLTFTDSNIPINVAEANGGSAFRSDNNVIRRILSGGNFYWAYPEDTTKLIWLVEYVAMRPDGGERTFRAFIDMLTGAFLKSIIVGVKDEVESIPTDYVLYQNYPNPFNPVTTISFSLPIDKYVTLSLFNALGQKVKILFEGNAQAGKTVIDFKADGFPSGVYYYQIKTGSYFATKKMLLIK